MNLGYGVDGMVVRLDRFDLQDRLGATSKAPRWCIAYKYPAEQGTTKLLDVQWQVGKAGTLTPRATMAPWTTCVFTTARYRQAKWRRCTLGAKGATRPS